MPNPRSRHAKEAGIAFSFAEGAAQPGGEDGTLLLVTVADHRAGGILAKVTPQQVDAIASNVFMDLKAAK